MRIVPEAIRTRLLESYEAMSSMSRVGLVGWSLLFVAGCGNTPQYPVGEEASADQLRDMKSVEDEERERHNQLKAKSQLNRPQRVGGQ